MLAILMTAICANGSPGGREPPRHYSRLLDEMKRSSFGSPSNETSQMEVPRDERHVQFEARRRMFAANKDDPELKMSKRMKELWEKEYQVLSHEEFIHGSSLTARQEVAASLQPVQDRNMQQQMKFYQQQQSQEHHDLVTAY
jgi:hypothetical protein